MWAATPKKKTKRDKELKTWRQNETCLSDTSVQRGHLGNPQLEVWSSRMVSCQKCLQASCSFDPSKIPAHHLILPPAFASSTTTCFLTSISKVLVVFPNLSSLLEKQVFTVWLLNYSQNTVRDTCRGLQLFKAKHAHQHAFSEELHRWCSRINDSHTTTQWPTVWKWSKSTGIMVSGAFSVTHEVKGISLLLFTD